MNSGHTLNIEFPCNLGISCNNSINLKFLFLFLFFVSFVAGKRGSYNAVVDGYRYTKNRSHKDRVYYRCVEQTTCKARITLTGGAHSTPLPQHTHPSQEAEVAVLKVKNNFRKI